MPDSLENHSPRVLVAGASVRALTDSCRRAGISEIAAIDLFADADLAADEILRAQEFPDELPMLAERVEPSALLVSGGIVNQLRLLRTLAKRHDWLGTHPDHIARVRDVFSLQQFCNSFGFLFPESQRARPVDSERWLQKSMSGSGGLHVVAAKEGTDGDADRYFQRIVEGTLCSAIAVGSSCGSKVLAGMIQFSGCAEVFAPEYFWSGNLGPVRFGPRVQQDVESLVAGLVREFSLVGVFGIDFIIRDGHPWLLEVNPRYTGSVEVLEHARQISVLAEHIAVCQLERDLQCDRTAAGETLSKRFVSNSRGSAEDSEMDFSAPAAWNGTELFLDDSVCLKWILYAPELVRVESDLRLVVDVPNAWIADVPHAATTVEPGHPVCSVFARGTTIDDCLANGRKLVGEVLRLVRS